MAPPSSSIRRIVSGGQTGVDQAALSAAIWMGVDHGGWCPAGRRSEAGRIPDEFKLQETESANYAARTRANVADSDGTLIIFRDEMSGGTALTEKMAIKHGRPYFLFDLNNPDPIENVLEWIHQECIATLNVAGPRESTCPGITDEARQLVVRVLESAGD